MLRFRSMKALQKFSAIHASVQNHFNQERHLVSREKYNQPLGGPSRVADARGLDSCAACDTCEFRRPVFALN